MSETSVLEPQEKFYVVGLITCTEFQKSRYIVTRLHKCFPKLYESPHIRPMLNVEWEEFLTNKRRKYGNGLWALRKPMAVFLNDEFLGDDVALSNHVSKKFRFTLNMNWHEICKCHLAQFLKDIMAKYRQLAYITVAINHRIVGTMLFELYNDLVPLACEIFLSRCKLEKGGYTGAPIQRIMKTSWIQCGGWTLTEKPTPCENYVVPHDRRGVLCTCNDGRHKNNSSQFFVTLAPTPWMDYRYVAFGQLLQGAEVLRRIEEVPTTYERPEVPIEIAMSGELTFDDTPNFTGFEELRKLRHMPSDAMLDSMIDSKNVAHHALTTSKPGFCSMESYLRDYPDMGECLLDYEQVEKFEEEEESKLMMSPSSEQLSLDENEDYCQSPSSDTTL